MPEAERDPIEPPPLADEVKALREQIAVLLVNDDALRTENATLRAERAERAERDAEHWMPLKRAAGNLDMPYQDALAWAKRAIKAGRVNEARKPDGRVIVNVTALRAYRDLRAPPRQ